MSLGEEAQLELRRMLRDKNVFEMAKVLPMLPPDLLQGAVTQLKLQGNKFFAKKEYARAIECYTSCIAGAPKEAALYSNRSICYLREKEHDKAIQDAEMCIRLKPKWGKGYYRKGVVLMFQEKYDESVQFFRLAHKYNPGDAEIRRCLREAEGLEYNQRATLAKTMGEPLPKKPLRRPDIADPQFDPANVARKITAQDDWYRLSQTANGLTVFMQDTDLVWNAPKRLVQFVEDRVITKAWSDAIEACLENWEDLEEENEIPVRVSALPSILQFGTYLGFLTMNCVDRGCTEIQVVEPAPTLLRKVHDVVFDNYLPEEAKLLLAEIRLSMNDPIKCQPGREIPDKHDILMVAISWHHDLLSQRIIQQVCHAKNHFLKPRHRIMPCKIVFHTAAIQWLDNEHTLGVDMSEATNSYRWGPMPTTVDLHAQSHAVLSEATLVAQVDLQNAALIRSFDNKVNMSITRTGVIHGVVSWHTIYLTPEISFTNNPFVENPSSYRKPMFQYFDPIPVSEGDIFPLTVHFNLTNLWFESNPRSKIIRSFALPEWYFEMLHDRTRNTIYKNAVEEVISTWIANNPTREQCNVLDIGAGLGLLSAYAAQTDPKVFVYAVEKIKHIGQTCRRILKANGVDNQVKIVRRDARSLSLKDVNSNKADILLFEIFDAGLIGEGVLHFIEPIRNNVSSKKVTVMPLRGTVHAMVVEFRTEKIGKYNFEMMNSFRYQPDYFNMDITKSKDIRALSEPFEVCSFDFQKDFRREFSTPAKPEQIFFDVEMVKEGVASAIVFWWELQLTESISLCTGPFENYNVHWKQAVQYIPEVKVQVGAKLGLVAVNNTYGVSFIVHADANTLSEGIEVVIKPPRIDKQLEAAHEKLQELQNEFFKAMNNEKDFLKVRAALSRIALQPGEFHLNPEIVARLLKSFTG